MCGRISWNFLAAFCLATIILPMGAVAAPERGARAEPINQLTPAEKRAGWKLLFDGKTTEGWRGYKSDHFPTDSQWLVEDGCLKIEQTTGRPGGGGGDILTVETFTNFDFRFDWKISAKGDSGIYYFVTEREHRGARMFIGDNGMAAVGNEYQILDDARLLDDPRERRQPRMSLHLCAALYDLIAPTGARLRPVGEFNESRIVVRGAYVEHWLNGRRVVAFDMNSPAFRKTVAKSKFKDFPEFGHRVPTPILLQDHGDATWFRNLKILPLKLEK